MEEEVLRQQIVDTGLTLLQEGLVARTWGNVSGRVDRKHFLITPSGLSYTLTQPIDLALYDMEAKTYTGAYKPSSEKGIHAAAYENFPEAGFVIHTHQTYASAFSVAGFKQLKMTPEEKRRLGGIAEAAYGLPGTGKLKNAVEACFKRGAHTVLMKHHGTVVVGRNQQEAMERVRLLEEICMRNYKGHNIKEPASIAYSRLGRPLPAQLDDMAQMIGREIPVVRGDVKEALLHHNAVISPRVGIYVKGKDKEDTEALKILVEKAAVTALHCRSLGGGKKLSRFDITLMHLVYEYKYSKKKGGS
ncbi:MAG: class II aldolase/adducin family protein [Lachnospiraceae bacterium]|nr:class II aldolase/adducin family protein [Lachnospiraceae bacterium]